MIGNRKNIKGGGMFLVLEKQNIIMFMLSFFTLFLIFSYSFLLFLSVNHAHQISSNKELFSKLITKNSSLNSIYLTKKNKVVSENKHTMVKVNKVAYINSDIKGIAFNK